MEPLRGGGDLGGRKLRGKNWSVCGLNPFETSAENISDKNLPIAISTTRSNPSSCWCTVGDLFELQLAGSREASVRHDDTRIVSILSC